MAVVGDRVWLMLRPVGPRPKGPQKRVHYGTVIGVDDGPCSGVRVALDQPALTPDCYATHTEVHRVDDEASS